MLEKEGMNEKQKQTIIEMVGSRGIEKLVAISTLLPDNNTYKHNPYKLACRILWSGIENTEKRLENILEDNK